MERLQRLSNLWNWLPAFRAVAEVENLPAASKTLNISASALSRTVRLLEEELGQPLFDRVGRRLVLNHKGTILLAGVRNSMRLLNDAVEEVTSSVMSGPIRIASPGSFMPILVMPALRLLKERHPELRPVLESVGPGEIADRLLAGTLDIVLTDRQLQLGDELTADLLLDVSYGLYCGAGHPLYDRDEGAIDLATVQRHEFAAPPDGLDHWPMHLSRTIGVQTTIMSTGVDLCASGAFLAVLPDVVAQRPGSGPPLRRLPFDVCAPRPMYAMYRRSVSPERPSNPTGVFLTAIRDSLQIPGPETTDESTS